VQRHKIFFLRVSETMKHAAAEGRRPAALRRLVADDISMVVELSLLAWAPVFQSFENILGKAIYCHLFPDWRKSQAEGVESILRNGEMYTTWVAIVEDRVVGFVAYQLREQELSGEIYMLAVHPSYQNQGIGTQLNYLALDKMRAAGMELAIVGTGGDPGHAPARRAYEKAGFTPLPNVQYYQKL